MSQIDEKLIEIEYRLGKLENSQSPNVILQEKHIPEQRKGILEEKRLSNTEAGLEKIITLPVCDVCGVRLEERFVACPACGRKLCNKCTIRFDTSNYCLPCLRERINLSKRAFLVLYAVAKEVTNKKEVSKLTKVPKDDICSCIDELLELKLIQRKGISVLSKYSVTDDGMSAVSAFSQVYCTSDVNQFYSNLSQVLAGLKR